MRKKPVRGLAEPTLPEDPLRRKKESESEPTAKGADLNENKSSRKRYCRWPAQHRVLKLLLQNGNLG